MTSVVTPTSPMALRSAARMSLYRADFPRFAAEQLKIVTKRAALEPFNLWPFQRRLVDRVMAQQSRTGYIRQVWLKSRQIGHSTLAQGLVFHRSVLWPNINAVVVAHDDGTAQTIFQKAHRFYEHLDPWLKPMKRYSNKQELLFANPSEKDRLVTPGLNSRIVVASARNIHSGAGGTFHLVHLSEAARYPKPEEIETSTLQTVALAPGTSVVIESTARPEGHWFRAMCEQAQSGSSVYEFDFIGWHEDPTSWAALLPGEVIEPESVDEVALVTDFALRPEQLKWRRQTLAGMRGDLDNFRQEFPMTAEEAWVLRDFAVFPVAQLRAVADGIRPPLFHATPLTIGDRPTLARAVDGPLSVWELPRDGAEYDIGVDVALGGDNSDGDWSTAEVLKRPHGVQVAEYRGKIEPGPFAGTLNALGRCYNVAQMAVEIRGPGYYTNDILANVLAYPNLYIWRKKDTIKQRLSNYFGFDTTLQSKHRQLVPLAKDRLFRHVTVAPTPEPLIRSHWLWREMSIYIQQTGRDEYHAAPGQGNHDDLVMAWMLALLSGHDELGLAHDGALDEATIPLLVMSPAYAMTAEEARWPGEAPSGFWGDVDGWRAA